MKVSKQSKVMLLAAGLALLAPSAMKAQDDGRAAARAADLLKSQQIVADLKAIESDRATAESTLLSRWESVLDPNVYDVRGELASIASRAPAWQLYAASKVQDFSAMVRVLRGLEHASSYIDGLKADSPDPQVFGSTADQLVYTPIAPCRVVDTRGAGARTGILAAGAARTFDLTTDGFSEGQGGAASCPGLPGYSYVGWAVNITVTANPSNGWLTVWPFSGIEPLASQVNYAAGVWSVANGLNLTGCDGCADDVTIRANASSTHVIIDVFGYFQNAVVGQAAVTRLAGTPVSIANNAGGFVSGAACPAGTRLIAGDVDHGWFDVAIGEYTGFSTIYTAWMINRNGAIATGVTAYSRCLNTPIYVP